MRNILILGKEDYSVPFEEHGKLLYDVKKLESCDLVVFTGGSDVNPELYGDTKLETTYIDEARDKEEQLIYNLALFLAIPMVGICRGMQFLNVMNDGYLIQDINNHTNCIHEICTNEGEVFEVVGDHHQLCIAGGHHKTLAYACNLSDKYLTGENFPNGVPTIAEYGKVVQDIEQEAIWWPNTQCLGVQYHPEWMDEESRGYTYFQDLLTKYIFNEE